MVGKWLLMLKGFSRFELMKKEKLFHALINSWKVQQVWSQSYKIYFVWKRLNWSLIPWLWFTSILIKKWYCYDLKWGNAPPRNLRLILCFVLRLNFFYRIASSGLKRRHESKITCERKPQQMIIKACQHPFQTFEQFLGVGITLSSLLQNKVISEMNWK